MFNALAPAGLSVFESHFRMSIRTLSYNCFAQSSMSRAYRRTVLVERIVTGFSPENRQATTYPSWQSRYNSVTQL